jgi:hypothetical protein
MSGSAIRGSRLGSGGHTAEAERGEAAPRIWVSFWCASKHETRPAFAADAPVPQTWECPRCGSPAGQDEQNPPSPSRAEPYKTHLAYVKDRRSDSDGEAILAEALARLRGVGSARAAAPEPQPTDGAADNALDDPGQRGPAGDDGRPEAPGGRAATAAEDQGPGDQQSPPPAPGETTRRSPGRAGRTRPAGRAGSGEGAARPARGPGRADGGTDQVAAETAADQEQRTPAESRPPAGEPRPAVPAEGRRCGECKYPVDSRSHKGLCLGQW